MRNLGTTLTMHSYTARFVGCCRTNSQVSVAVLTDVMDERGNFLTDHVWFKQEKFHLNGTALQAGERYVFSAEPYRYIKGAYGTKAVKRLEIDIGLRNIVFFALECQKN